MPSTSATQVRVWSGSRRSASYSSGVNIAEIARSIGVHEMTLGKWVKKARDDGEESNACVRDRSPGAPRR